jgi:hypothetical protein
MEASEFDPSRQSLLADVNPPNNGSRFDESLAALREAAAHNNPRETPLARLLSLRDKLLNATEPAEAELILSQSLAEAGPFRADPEFATALTEIETEVSACRSAVQAAHEHRIAECIDHCDNILREKPNHVLFLGLKVQAKAVDYSSQMAALAHIRALVDCGPLTEAQAAIKKASVRFPDSSELWDLDFDLRAKAIEVRNRVERGEEQLKDGNFDGAANSFSDAFQLLPFDTELKSRIVGVLHFYAKTIAEIDWQSAEKALDLVPFIDPDCAVPEEIAAGIQKAKLREHTDPPPVPHHHAELTPEILETTAAQSSAVVESELDASVIDIGPPPGRRSFRHLLAVCALAAALFLVVRIVASRDEPEKPAAVPTDITPGSLLVHANVPDISVLINKRKYVLPSGALAAEIALAPATYQIRVMHKGYADFGPVTATIKPGGSMNLDLHLKPNPSALEISHAEPGTKVSVDGKRLGEVPKSGTLITEVVPGQHSVELTRDGFTGKEFVRFFSSGEAATLTGRDVELQSTDARVLPEKHVDAPAPIAAAPPSPAPQEIQQTAWQHADKHDAHSLQAFVTAYPESPYAAQARDQLQLLAENDAWNTLDRTNRSAVAAFLASHPSGSHAAAATAIVADLDRRSAMAEAQRQEETAWLSVPKDNRQSIEAYLAKYPLSRHRDEAQRAMGKISSLEANRAESAAVLEVLHRFAAAWNAKDLKQIASIQHDLDIRQLRTQLAPVKSVVMKISPVMDPQIDGKQATVVCRRQASETFSDGSTRQNPSSIVTYVLTKQGSVWSIEHAR